MNGDDPIKQFMDAATRSMVDALDRKIMGHTGDEPALPVPQPTSGNEPEMSGARPKCKECGAPYAPEPRLHLQRSEDKAWLRICQCNPNEYHIVITSPEGDTGELWGPMNRIANLLGWFLVPKSRSTVSAQVPDGSWLVKIPRLFE